MENDAQMKKQEREQIVELGSDITKSQKGNIYTLTIIGQVEGHQVAPETVKTTKYEHVLPLLAGIEESDDIDGLLLLLRERGKIRARLRRGLRLRNEIVFLFDLRLRLRVQIRRQGELGDVLVHRLFLLYL